MKKVAIFSHEIPSTTFIENLIEGLANEGIEIFLFGFKKKEKQYSQKNIHVFYFPTSKLNKLWSLLTGSIYLLLTNRKKLMLLYKLCMHQRSFKDALDKVSTYLPIILNKVDIFHFQWGGDIQVYQEIFTLLDCKIVLSFRGAHINYAPLFREDLRAIYCNYFPKIDAFHSVSDAIAEESLQYGADLKKIKTIYTSVSPDLLAIPIEANKTANKKNIHIISVGRFHWKKGYGYAIDAIAKLVSKGIQVKYTIVAQGSDIEEYKFQIHQLNLGERVEIVNGLPHTQVVAAIKEADLFLLPSLEEGIANVAIEAMALGTFVISTDCGGMKEAISNDLEGFIVPVRDSVAITLAVEKYINLSETTINEIRLAARKKVETRFERNRMIRDFAELYRSLS